MTSQYINMFIDLNMHNNYLTDTHTHTITSILPGYSH